MHTNCRYFAEANHIRSVLYTNTESTFDCLDNLVYLVVMVNTNVTHFIVSGFTVARNCALSCIVSEIDQFGAALVYCIVAVISAIVEDEPASWVPAELVLSMAIHGVDDRSTIACATRV